MQTPIFVDDVLTLYNADMTTLIQSLKFDYVITDPPYNCNYKYPDYKDNLPSKNYIELLTYLEPYKTIMIHYPEEFCGDVGEALGRPNKLIAWVYNSNLRRQYRSIGWFGCKPNLSLVKQPYKNLKDKRILKNIANGSTGAAIYDWWNINLVKNVNVDKVTSFTNQIPVEVLERIILTTTQEGDTICDPFFGSGSLYFACKNTNRKCIGIEQSMQHINSFKERLDKVTNLL